MDTAAGVNGSANHAQTGTARVKRGMAEMLKGGVIMDVTDAEQARIAGEHYEAMLGDTGLVRNQLFCTHQRAHGDCAASCSPITRCGPPPTSSRG